MQGAAYLWSLARRERREQNEGLSHALSLALMQRYKRHEVPERATQVVCRRCLKISAAAEAAEEAKTFTCEACGHVNRRRIANAGKDRHKPHKERSATGGKAEKQRGKGTTIEQVARESISLTKKAVEELERKRKGEESLSLLARIERDKRGNKRKRKKLNIVDLSTNSRGSEDGNGTATKSSLTLFFEALQSKES